MTQPKILAFAGSTRTDSYNKRLVKIAAEGAKNAGADVTIVDLRDFPMPLFDEDLEAKEGMPDTAKEFRGLIQSHGGLLIASPEYNSSISGVLKNAIDWASRPLSPNDPPAAVFPGKIAAIMAASPGGLGGLRGLTHVREILGNIGVMVIPDQRAISSAFSAFDETGKLKDPKQQEAIESLGAKVAKLLTKLQ